MDEWGDNKVFVILKNNVTLNCSRKCISNMKEFFDDIMKYLEQYHQRNNSESRFTANKKMLGWNIAQRRDDTIYNTCSVPASGTIYSIQVDFRIVSHRSKKE